MSSITFITADGRSHTLEIANGTSVMQGAVNAGVEGIEADCGGSAACATCHVYVAREWMERLPTPSVNEASMLGFVINPDECSRLSCQITAKDDLNGLVVRIPPTQR
jgi:ferredoxin, 2Fe-2S